MNKPRLTVLLFAILLNISELLTAQTQNGKITYAEYIKTYREIAIQKMNEYGIPASITLAQGLLESGTGNSSLAVNANNHFGIKCHKEWTGMTYTMDDDEKNECFRKYASAEESYNDHSYFLTSRPRYAFLFQLDRTDYKGWAYGLKTAGYATNPRYAEMLIKIIEENELYLYDKPGAVALVKNEKPADEDAGNNYVFTPSDKTFKFLEVGEGNRKIYVNNNVKLIYARPGDTPQTIAYDLGIHSFQVYQYNELGRSEMLKPGQVIYVEPKKRKAEVDFHIIQEGESMREISQMYGVKLKALYKKNNLPEGHEPETGTKLYLRIKKSGNK